MKIFLIKKEDIHTSVIILCLLPKILTFVLMPNYVISYHKVKLYFQYNAGDIRLVQCLKVVPFVFSDSGLDSTSVGTDCWFEL